MSDRTRPPEPGRPAGSGPAAAATSPLFLHCFTIALFVYGWLSVNIYLPILPRLEEVFQIGGQTAKLTVTVFLLGFGFSQLIWGPVSDRFGRKPVLLAGLTISVIGAVLSGLAPTIGLFMAARFAEALGLGVGPVLGRAVLSDTFADLRRGGARGGHA
jgi:DHA1 family bicyclomycin/chloramphenicol resistance-like MFS transporter